jgi:hypothetical protein
MIDSKRGKQKKSSKKKTFIVKSSSYLPSHTSLLELAPFQWVALMVAEVS